MYNPEVGRHGMKLIAEFCKKRRTALGMSQRRLAEIAGIRQATLLEFEKTGNVKLETLFAIIGAMKGQIYIDFNDPEEPPAERQAIPFPPMNMN